MKFEFFKPSSVISKAAPLFPIGCPRSGTTLLCNVLNSHPRILMTNETAVFLQLGYIIERSRAGYSAGILYGKEHHQLWAEHLEEQARGLIETYYEKIAQREKKKSLIYWGEKHPHHMDCFTLLTSLYPAARYIYIVRDPRDTACSIAAMNRTDRTEALRVWKIIIGKYEVFLNGLDSRFLLVIRYEDFVRDYEEAARKIFRWLGVDYAEEVSTFLSRYRSVDANHLWMPEEEQRRADFPSQSVGRWRREFTEEEKGFAEELVSDFLQKYDYS